MLTEEQARTKHCPHLPADAVHDRNNDNQPWQRVEYYPTCIASRCMQWRWLPLMADDEWAAAVVKAAAVIGDNSPSRNTAAKHVNKNRAEYRLPTKPFQGYCGLAGKPEVA